jgi:hypothetical protein
MDDELETKIRDLHSQGEISDTAFRELLGGGERDVDVEVEKIIEESIEMGDRGAPSPPEGQTCERDGCDEDVVRGLGDEWLCREHQDELFAAWHG